MRVKSRYFVKSKKRPFFIAWGLKHLSRAKTRKGKKWVQKPKLLFLHLDIVGTTINFFPFFSVFSSVFSFGFLKINQYLIQNLSNLFQFFFSSSHFSLFSFTLANPPISVIEMMSLLPSPPPFSFFSQNHPNHSHP